jgi:hypothetical protein
MTRTRIRLTYAVATALFACLAADPGNAQSVQAEDSDSKSFDEALDEEPIDVRHSIGWRPGYHSGPLANQVDLRNKRTSSRCRSSGWSLFDQRM